MTPCLSCENRRIRSSGPVLAEYDDEAGRRTRGEAEEGSTLDQESPRAVRFSLRDRRRKYAAEAQVFLLFQSGSLLFPQLSCACRRGHVDEVCVGYLRWGIMSVRQRTEGTSTGRRSWTLSQPETTIEVLNYVITLARGFLQSFAIEHTDCAARIFNRACALQHSGSYRDARPAAAEHLCQKFVGQRDPLGINSVLAHEKPARQPLVEFMQAVAGRDLGYLQPLRQNVPIEMRLEFRRQRQNCFQCLRWKSEPAAGNLHNRAKRAARYSHRERSANHSFFAHQPDFDTLAILDQYDQRDHPLIREIGKIEFFSLLMHDKVTRKFEKFEVRPNQLIFIIRNREQNHIAYSFARTIRPSTREQRHRRN